ncbi:hypothetical protein M7I_4313 [Glarea lozoyensis 74030]|uniref:Uncharacterized protein n=1 Tax=Glarea lozoyensis (strain ATCC 74030 / MF5533) TaxID=1104152 RepID=H0ENV0_GLAL7|nr:hypothetical protein M7I_4313 [Glarea lozoyensis 74030]
MRSSIIVWALLVIFLVGVAAVPRDELSSRDLHSSENAPNIDFSYKTHVNTGKQRSVETRTNLASWKIGELKLRLPPICVKDAKNGPEPPIINGMDGKPMESPPTSYVQTAKEKLAT